jgi:hypothetical protein
MAADGKRDDRHGVTLMFEHKQSPTKCRDGDGSVLPPPGAGTRNTCQATAAAHASWATFRFPSRAGPQRFFPAELGSCVKPAEQVREERLEQVAGGTGVS